MGASPATEGGSRRLTASSSSPRGGSAGAGALASGGRSGGVRVLLGIGVLRGVRGVSWQGEEGQTRQGGRTDGGQIIAPPTWTSLGFEGAPHPQLLPSANGGGALAGGECDFLGALKFQRALEGRGHDFAEDLPGGNRDFRSLFKFWGAPAGERKIKKL